MMKISQFLPKGVGVLFPEKPYLKRNNHPLPVKKSNPEIELGKSVFLQEIPPNLSPPQPLPSCCSIKFSSILLLASLVK